MFPNSPWRLDSWYVQSQRNPRPLLPGLCRVVLFFCKSEEGEISAPVDGSPG